jgi:hypothetical protein
MKKQKIASYYVYPAIGIARVGNSTDEYYIGPEVPNQEIPMNFKYKDAKGRIKRQAVKFRVFGLDIDGKVIQEIVAGEDTSIEWTVHLANRKAINYQFNNAMDLGEIALESRLRNETVSDWNDRKKHLLIDPGSRKISGINQDGKDHKFDTGTFYGEKVPLGELRTDEKGRLIVLGGFGHSASKDNAQAITFANNDGWHDDTSDGPVRATVVINGQRVEAKPAMVCVTPPNFAPGLRGVVTLYDVVIDLFYREKVLQREQKVEFWRDIHPIFQRLVENQAVNEGIYFMFGQNSPGDLSNPALLDKLASKESQHKKLRLQLFSQFRDPNDRDRKDAKQPPFYGDAFGDFSDSPLVNLSVTATQYSQLKFWAEGDFQSDEKFRASVKSIDDLHPGEQPAALTATNLLECLGGPFHPGIELTWFLRRISMWDINDGHDPLRLNILPEGHQPKDDFGPVLRPEIALEEMFNCSGPGTLTRFMGVPWQTDEASCRSGYDTALYLPTPSFWSARVPNQVMSMRSLKRLEDKNLPTAQRLKHMNHRQDWLRFFQGGYQNEINAMVQQWDQIGIVTRQDVDNAAPDDGIPPVIWVESEVAAHFVEDDPSYKQLLALENLDTPVTEDKLNQICGIDETKADQDPKGRRVYRRDER